MRNTIEISVRITEENGVEHGVTKLIPLPVLNETEHFLRRKILALSFEQALDSLAMHGIDAVAK